ncbi:bifunctional nuclease [Dionaea muscipula]
MGTLQGTVIFPTVRAKEVSVHRMMVTDRFPKAETWRSGFQGFKFSHVPKISVGILNREGHALRHMTVCGTYSSSNGNGSMAENINESDGDYINSSVVDAVEVKSGSDGLTVKMSDGRSLKCVHNNPQGGHMPEYAPHPAIVLKIEDGTGLLFPIIVLEMPSVLLMAAIHNVHSARPTMYEVVKEIIERMGYEVKLVRITRRVHEAYFAQLYLSKVDNEADSISFDLRPSDAINIAVRCKVPIQVNKNLVHSDGMRIVEEVKLPSYGPASDGLLLNEWDRPSDLTSVESTEFNLLRNMVLAAAEERYKDAARWRDELTRLRAKRNWA